MAAGRDHDVVVVGDFRFPGGTSTGIAEEIRAQAAAGYRTGLIQRQTPRLRSDRGTHPDIQRCLDDGLADVVHDDRPLSTGLLTVTHPYLLEQPQAALPPISAERAILVAHHPPADARGVPYYDVALVHENLIDLAGPHAVWAPISPAVRRQLAATAADVPLLAFDWLNVIDATAWKLPRRGLKDGRLAIGRHARPDPLKWPASREAALSAWPAAFAYDVQILGGDRFLRELYAPLPANWTVYGFDEVPVKAFLGRLHAFVYFHHELWVEAFGRNVLEAMASGAVCILPESFRELFGEGALYTAIGDVPELLERLRADPVLRSDQAACGLRAINERYGPAVHIERLRRLIGDPAPRPRTLVAGTKPPAEQVLMLSSNGVGLGHLTRLLAVAGRLPSGLTPVFVSMSQALPVVERLGHLVEFIPFHGYLDCDIDAWNRHLRDELDLIMDFYRPRVVIFDGNTAYGGLVELIPRWPDCRFVWLRRAMWSPHGGRRPIERQSAFARVIEPGDIAEERDRGPTVRYRGRVERVHPITLLDDADRLPRAEARRRLRLPQNGLAVMIQPGSGNNLDIVPVIDRAVSTLAAERDAAPVLVEWLNADDPIELHPHLRRLRDFPNARYLSAFDYAISTAGYNSFHELINAGLPTIFVPNTHPSMDDQLSRAEYARDRGAGFLVLPDQPAALPPLMALLRDPAQRAAVREACALLTRPNGAGAAAAIVARLAEAST